MNRGAAVWLVLWVSAITQYPAEVQSNALTTTQRLVTKSFYEAHVFRFLCFKFQHEQFRFNSRLLLSSGPGSVVGIATGYGAGRYGDRIPVGRDFPHLSQPPVQWVLGLSRG